MKLALVFLIVGGFLLSCSLQQQILFCSYGWNPNIYPQTVTPYYYFANDADDSNEISPQLYEPSNDVQNRPPLSTFFKSDNYKNNHLQSRLFRFLMFNQLKNSLLSSLPTVTFTSTSTSVNTRVATITTLALQNCISIAQFAGAAGAAFSTTPCFRKKRSIEFVDGFDPSKVIPMETSLTLRNDDELNSDPYVLSSSFLDVQEESDVATPRKVGFSKVFTTVIPKSILVITSTTTTTSFFFVASTVKKPFTLGAPAVLTCLPPGFVVC